MEGKEGGSWREEINRILAENGEGKRWMREVERVRRGGSKEGEVSECKNEV